jgi:predicted Zn-dependent peptidase
MVRDPVMDPLELEKERLVILEELASVEDSPEELAGILSDETLWPAQPLGRNVGGAPASVEVLAHADVLAYFRRQYLPSNTVVSVAGNIDNDDIVAAVERWLGDVPTGQPGPWHPVQPRDGHARVAVHQKDTEQAHLCLAFPTVSMADPDRFAVDLLSTILGEGMSSRLFLDLREERALVYDVHSYPSEYRDAGSLTIYAGCDPSRARVTVEAALVQVAAAIDHIPEAEFAKAREMARGRIQLRMEDTRAVAGWQGAQLLLRDEVLSVDDVVAKLERVTLDDMRRVGSAYLQPANATLAAVGPFKRPDIFDGLI